MPQEGEKLHLDLSHPFSTDSEGVHNVRRRMRPAVCQAQPQPHHGSLSLRHSGKCSGYPLVM
jgi:hypothetical protein